MPAGSEGEGVARELFTQAESALQDARSYRGKMLSLELDDRYTGQSIGLTVHRFAEAASGKKIHVHCFTMMRT